MRSLVFKNGELIPKYTIKSTLDETVVARVCDLEEAYRIYSKEKAVYIYDEGRQEKLNMM